MEEADERFEFATQYVGAASSSGTFNDSQLLQFYGLYKQATAGPCDTPKPSFFDRKGRAKWQAWADRGALSASQAQQQYVELLTRLAPDWAGAPGSSSGGGDGGGKRQGGAGGPVQSRMAEAAEEEEGGAGAPPLLQAAREGDVGLVERTLAQGGCDVNQRGSEGETALHWAADKGHLPVLRLLLSQGADINATDADGLSPLHYAALAEQREAAEVLAAAPGVRLDLRSGDGETAADVAPPAWEAILSPGGQRA